MKEIPGTIFVAFDGKKFADKTECDAHEAENWRTLLVGLTVGELADALSRKNVDAANALEMAGKECARARLGGRLRAPAKPKATTPDNADALARAAASKLEPVQPSEATSWAPQDIKFSSGSQISTNPEDRRESAEDLTTGDAA